MQILDTLTPIFVVIMIGWLARKKRLINADFLSQANRLVYYLSIPALIFISIARSSFHDHFNATVLTITLVSAVAIYLAAFAVVRLSKLPQQRAGAFVLSSGHGNLGYVGLPIAVYYLGDSGLTQASVICGFLMILQNLLSTVSLQLMDKTAPSRFNAGSVLNKLVTNPVILGAMSGIIVSWAAIPVPHIVQMSLEILGKLAPPMALMLIGASLSLSRLRRHWRSTLGACFIKLFALPGLGVLLFTALHIEPDRFLPALILLCAPTATVVYVLTKELGSDEDFAVASISASTLLSLGSYMFWLSIAAT